MRRTARLILPFAATLAFAAAGAPHAGAQDVSADVDRHMRTLRQSSDPVARSNAVRDLAALPSPTVPVRLSGIARRDQDAGIRVAAATGLGTTLDTSATRVLLDLACDGGTHAVRLALARSLDARGAAARNLAVALDRRNVDLLGRERLIEALGASADPFAAGTLEVLATTGPAEIRATALRALCDHAVGRDVAPAVIAQALAAEEDLDGILTALELARRFGDGAIRAAEPRLRARKLPTVDRALDGALAWVAFRERARKGLQILDESNLPPAAPRREDHVHVFHRCEDLKRIRECIRSDMTRAEAREADVRVALVAYREADAKPATVTVLPFTRDPARVEEFLVGMTVQTRRPNGAGMSLAVDTALDRMGWRWDAERSVLLYADTSPRDVERIRTEAGVHWSSDGTRTSVLFLDDREDEIPKPLVRAAEAGGGSTVRAPKLPEGRLPWEPGSGPGGAK